MESTTSQNIKAYICMLLLKCCLYVCVLYVIFCFNFMYVCMYAQVHACLLIYKPY